MNCRKGNRLRPPGGIGAIAEKGVHHLVAKFARVRQVLAKFSNGLCPIIGPRTGPVVDYRFRSATDSLETQGCQPRRQGTANLVIDSSFTGPCKPTTPECTHLRRLGDRDRKEIWFNQDERTPPAASLRRDWRSLFQHCQRGEALLGPLPDRSCRVPRAQP